MSDIKPPKQLKNSSECVNMQDVRYEVDRLDQLIVELLAQRQTFMDAAARIKADRNLVRDEARIEDVVSKVKQHASEHNLSHDIVEPVYRLLIEKCIAHEFNTFDKIYPK